MVEGLIQNNLAPPRYRLVQKSGGSNFVAYYYTGIYIILTLSGKSQLRSFTSIAS